MMGVERRSGGLIAAKVVKARRVWRCAALNCERVSRVIAPGESYVRMYGGFEQPPYVLRTHEECCGPTATQRLQERGGP